MGRFVAFLERTFQQRRQRRHEWIQVSPHFISEPGISDVDNGKWARILVFCEACDAERLVWHRVGLVGLDHSPDLWGARIFRRQGDIWQNVDGLTYVTPGALT